MQTIRRIGETLHYLVRSLLLGGFTYFIIHLVKTDHLQYYIAPRMMSYVKYATLPLFALSMYFLYEASQQWNKQCTDENCGCSYSPDRPLWRKISLLVLFSLPLLLGFALPDKIMGSDIVSVKGINLNASGSPSNTAISTSKEQVADDSTQIISSQVPGVDANIIKLFPSDSYSQEYAKLGMLLYSKDFINVKTEGFLEILTTLDMYKANFMGKKISISGFVYREPDMSSDQFVISRMTMTCCSADATPYGLLVESSQVNLKNDTWVHLTGIITNTVYRSRTIIQINASDISKISAPRDPYAYPLVGNYKKLAE